MRKKVMSADLKFVLVQHSAYGYKEDPTFKGGLEIRMVSGANLVRAEKLGVPIYGSYGEAAKAEHAFMYPDGYEGMVPVADRAGSFSHLKIDSLAIYVPTEAGREAVRKQLEAA